MKDEGFIEAGNSTPVVEAPTDILSIPAPSENKQYTAITSQLQTLHGDLLRLEREGKLANISDNPGLASEYQRKLRLNVNMLFAFKNQYIDVLSDLQKEYAELRQRLFEERMLLPKSSPSASETYATEKTRVAAMSIKIVENRINQIANDYERYNGICISLQSTMKAENTERIMG